MKIVKITVYLISTLLLSCDVQTNILIVNNTNSAIVKISYNREYCSLFLETHKKVDLLNIKQSHNRHLKFINCDTINSELSFSFKLLKNDTLYIDKSRGSNPNYSSIDSITIIKDNTRKITLQSDNYEQNFKKTINLWIYNIK